MKVTVQHIWACTCGHEQKVEAEACDVGYVYECPNCTQVWGCLRPRIGGKAWIKVRPEDVKFHGLLDEPEEV